MTFDDIKNRLKELEREWDALLEAHLDKVDIQNRVLSDCLKDQIELHIIFDEIHAEVGYICDLLSVESENMFSIAVKELMKDSYRKLSISEAKSYALSDESYVENKKVEVKANALKAKIKAVVDAIVSRRYVLNSYVNVLQHGNESYII